MNEFIFAIGQRSGAFVHCFGDRFIDEIDYELMREADIPRGIFGCAIVAIAGREGQDRRVGAHQVEEAERRGIDFPFRTHGRDEGDRARRNQARQDRVGAVRELVFNIQFHAP